MILGSTPAATIYIGGACTKAWALCIPGLLSRPGQVEFYWQELPTQFQVITSTVEGLTQLSSMFVSVAPKRWNRNGIELDARIVKGGCAILSSQPLASR